jgi:hypothetical protein
MTKIVAQPSNLDASYIAIGYTQLGLLGSQARG